MSKACHVVLIGCLVSCAATSAESTKKKEEPVLYTNEDLPAAGQGSSPSSPPAESTPTVEIPSYEAIRDRSGNGEGWWRQRACELDARIVVARVEAQRALVAYKKSGALVDPTAPARAKEATESLLALEAERAGLPEELRQADGLPGWLRGGTSCLESPVLPPPETAAPGFGEAITLSWTAVSPGARYVVELQCLDCCGMIGPCAATMLDAGGTSLQVPSNPGRSHRWRVRAIDPAGPVGEWSPWQSFESPPR